ncbi:hypothetical protein [Paraliobacillus sp. JSM ZJ581]|uniref:hypothetical protein n=1 Tax=Paraliobacillus sp. JSM ZJ581 TaxID=3342118 RepID=UPI0035A9229A
MKSGISDIPLSELKSKYNDINAVQITKSNPLNKSLIESQKFVTSEIIEETTKKGLKKEKIVVTTFNDISNANNVVSTMSDTRDGVWDGSYYFQAYSRIYYTKLTRNRTPMRELDRVTGGWKVADSSVSLSNRRVRFGASGWPVGSQAATRYPSGIVIPITLHLVGIGLHLLEVIPLEQIHMLN